VDLLRRRTVHPLIWIILLFGGIGFAHRLLNQPADMLRQLLFIALLIAVVYVVYQLITRRRTGKEYSAYIKAVNQSKRLHHERDKKTLPKTARANSNKKGTRPSLQKKRKTTHLTVIEGKKGKKKNRAFF
jgi:prepilin signal peptidase PulO-like enzyme (type II secretory pathway)